MTIIEYIEKFARSNYAPKYQDGAIEELVDHMTGNAVGNAYIQRTCANLVKARAAGKAPESLGWYAS